MENVNFKLRLNRIIQESWWGVCVFESLCLGKLRVCLSVFDFDKMLLNSSYIVILANYCSVFCPVVGCGERRGAADLLSNRNCAEENPRLI